MTCRDTAVRILTQTPNVFHLFLSSFRWRFQYAFFTEESVGPVGCGGITCSDLFPVLSTLCDCSNCCNKKRALTLADIADMKPQYISNIVAAYWRQSPKTLPDTMIGLCSDKIEIITEDPGSDKLKSSLSPRHVKLADAMSTGAMVMKPTAELEEKYEPFNELQLILGLTGSNDAPSYPSEERWCCLTKVSHIMMISNNMSFLCVCFCVLFKCFLLYFFFFTFLVDKI